MLTRSLAFVSSCLFLTAAQGTAETFSATMLSAGAGAVTDRRPVPIGLYDAGVHKTWVTWMGSAANSPAIIKEYDHATGVWTANKVIGTSFSDKHNYPAIVKGADNRLYVFHGCHNSPLKMTKSPNPLSIAGTWTDRSISQAPGASYPAPVVTSNGTIYVGHRWTRQSNGHTDDRPYAFAKSTDNGATWSRLVVIDPYPRSDNLTEIYNGQVTYEPAHGTQKAKIHLAWTIAGGGPGTHAHATYGRNAYYAYLDPTNDRMYNVTGVDLGTTITNSEMETYCKVVDTGCSNCGHQASLQVSAHYMDSGLPIVVYGHSTNGLTASRWTGSAWSHRVITSATGEPRDIFKFGPQSFKAFRASGNTCQYFRSTDGGATWASEGSVTAPHPASRCNVIVNHHPDLKLFMEERADAGDTSVARVTSGFEPWYEVTGGGTPSPTPTPTPSPTATPTGIPPTPTPTPTACAGCTFVEVTPPGSAVSASTHDGNVPANTVDNSLATRWSANGDGAWIQYDLGSVQTLTHVRLAVYNGNGRQNRFDLLLSENGTTWSPAITGGLTSGTTTAEETHDFTDAGARYVRYVGHGSTVGTFNSLSEVSVFASTAPPPPTPTPTATPTPTPVVPTATPTATPTGAPVCVTAGATWQNRSFPTQTGLFTAELDATPSGAPINAAVGLSLGAQSAYSGFAALVAFSTDGNILARNGAAYAAQTAIPYSGGVIYRFRLVVNVPARTYSIFVRPAGGAEVTVGVDYAFRTEQASVTSLNNWGASASTGSVQVCGFSVSQ